MEAATAPVTLRFAAAGGVDAASVTTRVAPTQYSISDTTVRFAGRSSELGRITFEGRLDQGALATARRNLGDEAAVLTGRLTAGGETTDAVRLSWGMGG